MVGAAKSDETLGVSRGFEDPARFLQRDGFILGCVHYQQRFVETPQRPLGAVLRDVANELTADAHRSTGKNDLCDPLPFDPLRSAARWCRTWRGR